MDFGTRTLVVRRPAVSFRVSRRTVLVVVGLLIALAAISLVTLAVGTFQLTLGEVLQALVGQGDKAARMVVFEWRLPRLLFAIGCGIALALGGAIFQSITRNPLGSPDVIGFDAGAYTGALLVMLVAGSGSYLAVAGGAVAGGLATAAVVYVLAYRGGVQGFRLIVVGIGVSAMLYSVNSYLILSVDTQRALLAAQWNAGSLNALGYTQLLPFAVALVLLLPVVAMVAPSLAQNELGDDAARALGSNAERTRLVASVVAVALTALVTAAAGPIAFIALVAPQVSKRLTRSPGLGLTASALTGAVLLAASDFVAQRIALPVGLVTVSVGGCYLIWLLIREYRRS